MATQPKTQGSKILDRSAGAAIRGYCYQFDLTIIKILESSDRSIVTVEGLEDVDVLSNHGATATQVKYLEGSSYTSPKVLRKPLKLMLDAFANGSDYQFILHVYFGDGSIPPDSFTIDQLKTCLTEERRNPSRTQLHYDMYIDKVLEDFVKRLSIHQGLKLLDQRNEVFSQLATALGCHVSDAVDLHYGNALAHVQQIAMRKEVGDRKITRKQFLAIINKRSSLYTRWHKEMLGEDRYIRSLGRRIKAKKSLSPTRSKAVMLTLSDDTEIPAAFFELLERLAKHEFGAGKLLTTKPWTVILDVTKETMRTIKQELLRRGLVYFDGFEDIEFQPDLFAQEPVLNSRGGSSVIKRSSYDIRVLSIESFETFAAADKKFDSIVVTAATDNVAFTQASRSEPIHIIELNHNQLATLLEVSR